MTKRNHFPVVYTTEKVSELIYEFLCITPTSRRQMNTSIEDLMKDLMYTRDELHARLLKNIFSKLHIDHVVDNELLAEEFVEDKTPMDWVNTVYSILNP